jgi:uncharacterized protein YprB with RNaseH-like and TPR domain
MSSSDLRTRLQRLRVQKIKRKYPPPTPGPTLTAAPIQPYSILPGREVTTPHGAYQLVENAYALDHPHGPLRLADLFTSDAAVAARLARDEALTHADLRSLAFLDTETTGLEGGAGTLVFLVGVGVVEGDQFVVRQYFLRDPAEELAMLTALVDDLAPRIGWITFNGRAFDLPLLETRLTLNRRRGALGQRPHLDLLMPTRRLYRGRLASCSLGHVEQHVLNILRDQADVPGALIPQMYLDYLRTGDPSEMHRVIYHNAVDILSMVTLAAHLLNVFATNITPEAESLTAEGRSGEFEVSNLRSPMANRQSPTSHLQPPASRLQPEDLLRLARWHDDNGREAEAEAAYRAGLAGQLPLDARRAGLTHFAAFLKGRARRAEAVPLWEQLASFTLDDPSPFVELAKFYEWHAPDFPKAIAWTERALQSVSTWPKGWQRSAQTKELRQRLQRLKGKRGREA